MSETLVIRFGSLGDLCLLGWALARHRDRQLAQPSPATPDHVTLVTKPAFAAFMSHMRGVDEVLAPEGTGMADVTHFAHRLRSRHFDRILDAHNILRSHLLLGAMGRRPRRRLAKDTAARLLFLRAGRRSPALQRTMVDRFDALFAEPGLTAPTPPGRTIRPPLADLGAVPSPGRTYLGLAPGAQWDTKRWPADHFATLARTFLGENDRNLRIFLGPREETWFADSALQDLAGSDRVEVVRGRSLVEVAGLLADCRVLVTNDSGLLHLAEAVGTPVLAIFGPTVKEFGYFPHLPTSAILEGEWPCRPCSRNGKRPCHRGDLACLTTIAPTQAQTALRDIWNRLATEEPA